MLTTHYSNPQSVVPFDVAMITAATKTIDFAAYALDEPEIINALVAQANAGRAIRLYLDRTELCAAARGDATLSHSPFRAVLNNPNIQIKVKHSEILMHLKSYIVDATLLRDGSANFSIPGEEQQDNSILFTDDTQACTQFVSKFQQMWARPDNLTVQQAVTQTPQRTTRPSHRH
jgi:phosphatidylserine/phosphatidylglycerophosphate/cardiolipin synthase-like enzyme